MRSDLIISKNPSVELKLLRSIYSMYQYNIRVKKQIDDYYYENIMPANKDLCTLINIFKDIKAGLFEINFQSLNYIYNFIFPSVNKYRIDNHIISRFIDLNMDEFFVIIIYKHVFHNLSFIMALITYNIAYFKENNCFFNIGSRISKPLEKSIIYGDILEYDRLKKIIVDYNYQYHVPRKILSMNDIIKSLKLIPMCEIIKFQVLEIYLFGSHVKNCQNQYSDIDLKIVVKQTDKDLNLIATSLIKLLSRYLEGKLDIKVITEKMKISKSFEILFSNEIMILEFDY